MYKRQDIVSSLLHITDSQQNHDFKDNYFSEIQIDLSSLWFIYSMNSAPTDRALRDRLYIIDVPGYSMDDKRHIITSYTLPKMLKNVGLKEEDMKFTDNTCKYFLDTIDRGEPGIRNIEKSLKDLINKINFVHDNKQNSSFEFMSFDTKFDIFYPLTITNELIDNMCKKKDINMSKSFMYI